MKKRISINSESQNQVWMMQGLAELCLSRCCKERYHFCTECLKSCSKRQIN